MGTFNIWNSTVTAFRAYQHQRMVGLQALSFLEIVIGKPRQSGRPNSCRLMSQQTASGMSSTTGIYNFVSTLRGTTYLGLVVDNVKLSVTFTVPSPDYSSLVRRIALHQEFCRKYCAMRKQDRNGNRRLLSSLYSLRH